VTQLFTYHPWQDTIYHCSAQLRLLYDTINKCITTKTLAKSIFQDHTDQKSIRTCSDSKTLLTYPDTLCHASVFDAHVIDWVQRRKTVRKTILHLLQARHKAFHSQTEMCTLLQLLLPANEPIHNAAVTSWIWQRRDVSVLWHHAATPKCIFMLYTYDFNSIDYAAALHLWS